MARPKKDTTKEVTKDTKKAKETKVENVAKEQTPVELAEAQALTPTTEEKTKKTAKSQSKPKANLITGTGKRKTAVARVFLYETKGDFTVNGVDINSYFPTEQAQAKWMKPFHTIGVAHPTSKYSATIKVQGSGPAAQLSAVVHGFSRALAGMNAEFSEALRKNDLLTRDPRMVERKKYWLRKARKAPQYSKR